MFDTTLGPGLTLLAAGLQFPEGPIAMGDGSILLVEMEGETLTRIARDGTKTIIACLPGGPNGAAIGPDGRCYICNNGGYLYRNIDGLNYPTIAPPSYRQGWIEVVDLDTGAVLRLYESCKGTPLKAPNDLVFDRHGGFYFTDTGRLFKDHRQRGAVFYARADGSFIERVVFPMEAPNGIGLSPDGQRLYVAESATARIWAYDVVGPGQLNQSRGPVPWEKGHFIACAPSYSVFDSLAIDARGCICVADIPHGGISVFSAEGVLIERHAMPDPMPTNICFGGAQLKTAYITLSSTGRLVSMPWPAGGLHLQWPTHA